MTDRLRIITDYMEIFGQVQILNETVYHHRPDKETKQTRKGTMPGLARSGAVIKRLASIMTATVTTYFAVSAKYDAGERSKQT